MHREQLSVGEGVPRLLRRSYLSREDFPRDLPVSRLGQPVPARIVYQDDSRCSQLRMAGDTDAGARRGARVANADGLGRIRLMMAVRRWRRLSPFIGTVDTTGFIIMNVYL